MNLPKNEAIQSLASELQRSVVVHLGMGPPWAYVATLYILYVIAVDLMRALCYKIIKHYLPQQLKHSTKLPIGNPLSQSALR